MLYDPRWDYRNALTVKNLIAWLETQDPDTKYDYCNPSTCLVAKFLYCMGASRIILIGSEIPCDIHSAVHAVDAKDWTYGKALKRLRREHAA